MIKVVAFNKPFNVLSQFRGEPNDHTLAQFIHDKTLRIAGRLDKDSEGLLLLSNDGHVVQHVSHPRFKQRKTYLVQVEGTVTDSAIEALNRGVMLNDGPTQPADTIQVDEPKWLWARQPPIRYRAQIPTSWLQITITEGRNRQIRRMTAAVDFPTLRLIRTQIGSISLLDLSIQSGESTALTISDYPEFKKFF